MKKIAIIAITSNGSKIAEKLEAISDETEIFLSERYNSDNRYKSFEPPLLKELIKSLWKKFDAFVFIMATGIVVRMIADLIESKDKDPAVVVVDDAGKFSISLLSGHLGGANTLAQKISSTIGSTAVITTATDANSLPSIDMIAKELDFEIEDLSKIKIINQHILDKKEIAVVDHSKVTQPFLSSISAKYFNTFADALKSGYKATVFVTNRYIPQNNLYKDTIILRPKNLVAGIGCNRGTSSDEIEEFVIRNFKQIFLSIKSLKIVASATAKIDEDGLIQFAKKYQLDLKFYSSNELNAVQAPSPHSEYAKKAIGAFGVAEPAAIIASNFGNLLLKKQKSDNVTLAIAEIV